MNTRRAARRLLIALPLVLSGSCSRAGNSAGADVAGSDPVIELRLGGDLPVAMRVRVEELVRAGSSLPVVIAGAETPAQTLPAGSCRLSFGDGAVTRALLAPADLAALGAEGFAIRSGSSAGTRTIAAGGNPPVPDSLARNTGAGYGTYAALEALGFAFLHPLEPVVPESLVCPANLDVRSSPRWPVRGIQLHTMHPLELTDLLNGWGPLGPDDAAGFEAMLPEWERFLEWMTANRQNRVQWVLLRAESWDAFADSTERQARLARVVDLAHAWGVLTGGDQSLVQQQQHAMKMVRQTGTLEEEKQQIRDGVDWMAEIGFDFFTTESGTTEFTSPSCDRMLAWMDEFARHSADAHGKPAYMKVHVSSGQSCDEFTDPETGDPLNFNFLPHLADARLGVMPHTVQHYGLEDPAPTYGNGGFSHMREFLHEEAGARETWWHPETAYWVSFDIDVPLFLPLYAGRRLDDLRKLAADEDAGLMGRGEHAGTRMDGQMTFSSGWEWGYWLQEVVTARAAWDPHVELDDAAALRKSLDPVVAPFGPVADDVREILVALIDDQAELLIFGRVPGLNPATVDRRNGQAYLQGWETWDEVGGMLGLVPGQEPIETQPPKLGLLTAWLGNPDYRTEIEPLLAEMETRFAMRAAALEELVPLAPESGRPLLAEIADAARMTALRAKQVHALYDHEAGAGDAAWKAGRLADAQSAIDAAEPIVVRREAAYRVPVERIAGWRENPTAYEFGYLWTVRSLHYWKRDQGKATDREWQPCYRNVISGIDIGFGEGLYYDVAGVISQLGVLGVANACLAAPVTEPTW